MRKLLDVSGVQFQVTRRPAPKLASLRSGTQKVDPRTGLPLWTTQVTALDETGAEVIEVVNASQAAPEVTVGQLVVPVELEMRPWSNKDKESGEVRSGTAYRAAELRPLVPAER